MLTEAISSARPQADYRLVRLAGGAYSVHSMSHGETFHPVIGPVAEAQALYVDQLRLVERVSRTAEPFVIWDVGLGAAANPITVLNALQHIPASIRILSFDQTTAPLQFALEHQDALTYLKPDSPALRELVDKQAVTFSKGNLTVHWTLRLGDFPSLLKQRETALFPKPHAILFDAYSPARNPAMWRQSLFSDLYRLLDPNRPCALPTYSRSTMLRVSLLLAGFYVGAGHATGEKEETTIAANSAELIETPLPVEWLSRVRHSTSAEPLWDDIYRRAPVSDETWHKLQAHPQFQYAV